DDRLALAVEAQRLARREARRIEPVALDGGGLAHERLLRSRRELDRDEQLGVAHRALVGEPHAATADHDSANAAGIPPAPRGAAALVRVVVVAAAHEAVGKGGEQRAQQRRVRGRFRTRFAERSAIARCALELRRALQEELRAAAMELEPERGARYVAAPRELL